MVAVGGSILFLIGFKFGGNFIKIILSLILVLIVVGAISHAVSKHSLDAVIAKNCFDKYGNSIVVVKPENNNRRIELCLLPDDNGLFKGMAIRVSEKVDGYFQEITRYMDYNIKTINGMIDYAECEAGSWGWLDFIKVNLIL